jgi:SAM-dependent methyltransferase
MAWLASVSILLVLFAASSSPAQTADPMERAANDRQPHAKVMDAVGIRPGMVIGEVGAGLDMIIMVWVYHMLEAPVPLLKSLGPSLKPGATVVILDPVPQEVDEEFSGAAPGTKFTVPTREHVERDAGLAGFKLVQAMIGWLEKDNIFILRRIDPVVALRSDGA